MTKDEILKQIKEAEDLIRKLDGLMTSITVDIDYIQSDIDLEEIKTVLINVAKTDEWDINSEYDISYKDDPEKRKILFHGIKMGYSSALFWMADYFGLVEFFEDKIGHNFENINNEET